MIFSKSQAIEEMNRMGNTKVPFVFFTDFEGEKAWIKPIDQVDPEELQFSIADKAILGSDNFPPSPEKKLQFHKDPVGYESFKKAFDLVVHEINIGNSYLVNLTFRSPVKTNLSLAEIYRYGHARYKLWYNDSFVVFSPETFVKIRDGYIYSYPMKGTINADMEGAANHILSNPKETAEHVTIVDLIRNDLSRVSAEVEVTRFRYLTRITTHDQTLLQVSSEIRGRIPGDFSEKIGTILFSLLPAGSVSGAPKTKTLEIIHKAETSHRGFYTGICGFFDGESVDSGVMIRFIEKENGQLFYKSGGGITSFSDPVSEYNEIIDKIYVPVY